MSTSKDFYVSDTILYIPDRVRDDTLRYAQRHHSWTREKPTTRANGVVVIRKVSQEEMERLWRQ